MSENEFNLLRDRLMCLAEESSDPKARQVIMDGIQKIQEKIFKKAI